MKKQRYTQINPYYLEDHTLNRKLNFQQTIKQLNLQERIIQEKTHLITQIYNTMTHMEKKLQENTKNTTNTKNTETMENTETREKK